MAEDVQMEAAKRAAEYIQTFARAKRGDLGDLMRECQPNAGYGHYQGHEEVGDISIALYHETDQCLLNTRMPEDYASPESLSEMLNGFHQRVSTDEGTLMELLEREGAARGHVPLNAQHLYAAVVEHRRALAHSLTLLNAANNANVENGNQNVTASSNKPSPPDWANKTSALIAAGGVLAAVVAWSVRLEMRVNSLERQLAERAKAAPAATSTSTANDSVCRYLAAQYVEETRAIHTSKARDISALMDRSGCTKSPLEPLAAGNSPGSR